MEPDRQMDKPTELKVWVGHSLLETANSLYKVVDKAEPDRQTDTELKVWGLGLEGHAVLKIANSLYKVVAKVKPDSQTEKCTELKGLGGAILFLKLQMSFIKWLPRWSRTDRRTNPPN